MGKRFAIVIGVAAAGVMALGAQMAAAVVEYDTKLTLTKDQGANYHGFVKSDSDRDPEYDSAKAVKKCMEGRRVVVWKLRPGADRKLGTERTEFQPYLGWGNWWLYVDRDYGDRVRAQVKRKVRDGYVCRADRAAWSP